MTRTTIVLLSLLAAMTCLLVISFWHSQNGRFAYYHQETQFSGTTSVFDTRTGTVWRFSVAEGVAVASKLEIQDGKLVNTPLPHPNSEK